MCVYEHECVRVCVCMCVCVCKHKKTIVTHKFCNIL